MGSRENRWVQAMALALMNDADHWRSRAEEVRCIAEGMLDQEAARIMQGIAAGYDRLAQHAEARLLGESGRVGAADPDTTRTAPKP